MDVFSFGVVIYELLIRQVTSAVVSQSGDATMPEMYANKVILLQAASFFFVRLDNELAHWSTGFPVVSAGITQVLSGMIA